MRDSFASLKNDHNLSFKTKRQKRRKGRHKIKMESKKRPSPEEMASFLRVIADRIDAGDFQATDAAQEIIAKFRGEVDLKERQGKRSTETSIKLKLKWRSKKPKKSREQRKLERTIKTESAIYAPDEITAVAASALGGIIGTEVALDAATTGVSEDSLVGTSRVEAVKDTISTVSGGAEGTIEAVSDAVEEATTKASDITGAIEETVQSVTEEAPTLDNLGSAAEELMGGERSMFANFGIPGVEEAMTESLGNLEAGAAKDTLSRFGVDALDAEGSPRSILAVIDDLKNAGATGSDLLDFLIWLIENPVRQALNLSTVQVGLLVQGVKALFA
ncbi:amphi-Trp domain-containing protein [Magnetococcales bacterium HHB-1]